MNDKKYEKKPNTGSLWHEENVKCIRKGGIRFGNEEKYASILEFQDREGNLKHELVISVGLLHYNPPENKLSDTSPDIYGKITWNNKRYKFGGYQNTTQTGQPYTGVSLRVEEEENIPVTPKF